MQSMKMLLFLLYQFPEEQPFFTCPLPLCKDADYRKLIDTAFDYLKGHWRKALDTFDITAVLRYDNLLLSRIKAFAHEKR